MALQTHQGGNPSFATHSGQQDMGFLEEQFLHNNGGLKSAAITAIELGNVKKRNWLCL
jgi:hypothetical protein